MKWYYENGGGDWYDGLGRLRTCPKTHYIVSEDLLHRINVKSKTEAKKLLEGMNNGLQCSCSDPRACLNWVVNPFGTSWVLHCKVCGGNATLRAEVELGMTDKLDGIEAAKSWLDLMRFEHEQ